MSKQKQRMMQLTIDNLSLEQTLEFYELIVSGYRIAKEVRHQSKPGEYDLGLTTLYLVKEDTNE